MQTCEKIQTTQQNAVRMNICLLMNEIKLKRQNMKNILFSKNKKRKGKKTEKM